MAGTINWQVVALLLATISLIPGVIGAILARARGRNAVVWFLLSTFFWFSVLVILLLPPAKEVPGRFRQCSSCMEYVNWAAAICRHCGSALPSRP